MQTVTSEDVPHVSCSSPQFVSYFFLSFTYFKIGLSFSFLCNLDAIRAILNEFFCLIGVAAVVLLDSKSITQY